MDQKPNFISITKSALICLTGSRARGRLQRDIKNTDIENAESVYCKIVFLLFFDCLLAYAGSHQTHKVTNMFPLHLKSLIPISNISQLLIHFLYNISCFSF